MDTTIIKSFTTKKGHQAVIRPLLDSDFEALFKYANDLIAEDTFVLLSGKPMTREEEQGYLTNALKAVSEQQKIHLVVTVDGVFAGSFEVRRFDKRKSHVGEVGISIARDFREEGVGTVCLETLISEARRSGLKLLILHCFESNDRAIHTYEKVGFVKSGIVPGMYAYKGDYIGEVTLYKKL